MNVELFSAADFLSRYFDVNESAEIFYEIESCQNQRSPYWSKKNYQDILKENVHIAISCDGNSTERKDVEAFLIYRDIAPEIEILHWAVRKKGAGMGESFLRQFLKRSYAKKILLDCGETNEAAKKLYEKLGFKTTARREKYYSNGEAALLMSLLM